MAVKPNSIDHIRTERAGEVGGEKQRGEWKRKRLGMGAQYVPMYLRN